MFDRVICYFRGHNWRTWDNFLCTKEQCERCYEIKWIKIKTETKLKLLKDKE